jgi:hypothetical protein
MLLLKMITIIFAVNNFKVFANHESFVIKTILNTTTFTDLQSEQGRCL